MSFDAGSIMSTLGLDASPYAGGMLQATSIAQMFPSTVTAFMANPLLGVISLTKDVASAVSAMVASAISTLESMDNIGDMAANLGVSAGFLDSFQAVGKMNGANDAGEILKFLAKNAADAAHGSDTAAAAFRRLGVNVRDATGNIRPVADLLFDVADGMKAIPGPERIAVSMDLLGRSSTQMIGLLSQGSSALQQKMTDVNPFSEMTDQMAEDAGAFSDAMDMLSRAWEGIKREFAIPLGNALKPLMEGLLEWIKANREVIQELIRSVLQAVLLALAAISAAIAGLMLLLSPFVALFKGLLAGYSEASKAPAGQRGTAFSNGMGKGMDDGFKLSSDIASGAWSAAGSLLEASAKAGDAMAGKVVDRMEDTFKAKMDKEQGRFERAALEGRY